jgi:hypothetical protein
MGRHDEGAHTACQGPEGHRAVAQDEEEADGQGEGLIALLVGVVFFCLYVLDYGR